MMLQGKDIYTAALTTIPALLDILLPSVSYAQILAQGLPLDANRVVSSANLSAMFAMLFCNLLSHCPYTVASLDLLAIFMMREVLMQIEESDLSNEEKVATMWMSLHTTCFLSSAIFALLGKMRAVILSGYLSYPVVSGLMAAVGVAGVNSAVTFLWPQDEEDNFLAMALAVGLSVTSVVMKSQGIPTNLAFVLCFTFGFVSFYVWVFAAGMSGNDLRASGWLMEVKAASVNPLLVFEWDWSSVSYWHLIPGPKAWPICFVAAMGRAFGITGVEAAVAEMPYSVDDEMWRQGVASSLSGLLGGVACGISPPYTSINHQAAKGNKAVGRLTIVVSTICLALIWLSSFPLTNYLPRFLLGGLLMMVGSDMVVDWSWGVRRRIDRAGLVTVVSIMLVSKCTDLVHGIVLGVVLAICWANYRFATLDIIKYHVSGVHFRSGEDYSVNQKQVLQKCGRSTQVIGLTGFLFEGVALSLSKYVRELVHGSKELDALILDFFACQGITESVCAHLVKLVRVCANAQVQLILCNLHPLDQSLLMEWKVESEWSEFKPMLQEALAAAEQRVLKREAVMHEPCLPPSMDGTGERSHLEAWLGRDVATVLLDLGEVRMVPANAWLNTESGRARTQVMLAVPEHSDVQVVCRTGSMHLPASLLRTKGGAICPTEALIGHGTCGSWRTCDRSVVVVVDVDKLRRSTVFPTVLEFALRQHVQQTDQLSALYTVARGGGWHGATFDQVTQAHVAVAPEVMSSTNMPTRRRGFKVRDVKAVEPAPGQLSWSGSRKVAAVLGQEAIDEHLLQDATQAAFGSEKLFLNRLTGKEKDLMPTPSTVHPTLGGRFGSDCSLVSLSTAASRGRFGSDCSLVSLATADSHADLISIDSNAAPPRRYVSGDLQNTPLAQPLLADEGNLSGA